MSTIWSTESLSKLIAIARGAQPAPVVVKNARVINLFTHEILTADVALYRDTIAGVGQYSGLSEIDAAGMYLSPGLIDGHLHLESSMLSPAEFSRAVVPRGTTTVVIDPHEIANVAGSEGIEDLLTNSRGTPVEFYVMAPSCVPASVLETSGAHMTARDIEALYKQERVLGLAEVMDFVDVLKAEPGILERILVSRGRPIDGHAPGVTGQDLNAYCAAGMESDHETTTPEEGREKLRAGMYLMLRQGSAARDLTALAPLIDEHTADRCILVTDDLLPTDIASFGHIDHLLRMLVGSGTDPIAAVRMATLNPAQRFRLNRLGAVAPGCRANLVLFADLKSFAASMVISSGQIVARDGEMVVDVEHRGFSSQLTDSVHVGAFDVSRLAIPARATRCRVIGAADGQLTTRAILERPTVLAGFVVSDIERDILKVAVVERHEATGNVGLGLIRGFGLKAGAMASSVAHDAHNIIVAGASDQDMALAVHEVERLKGGLVLASGGEIAARLPLPVAGLITQRSLVDTCAGLREVEEAARALGCRMIHPFMTLSFMALEVIPSLKITDRGLVDVEKGELIDLFDTSSGQAADAASG